MRTLILLLLACVLLSCGDRASTGAAAVPTTADATDEILTKERAALDRWVHGDPSGYIALFAPEITYFDPTRDARVTGREAIVAFMQKIQFPAPPKEGVAESKLIDPKVQQFGDVALLTFNTEQAGNPVRWNSTEVYARIEGEWKIVHSHWSIVKPPLPVPIEGSNTAN